MWNVRTMLIRLSRHATISWRNPYFFSENLYQSVPFVDASMYCDTFNAIRIAMQFAKKSRHCVKKIASQRQRHGATEPKIGLVEIGALNT